ncbi:retrovirus-related pol polyprotein from transposon TNT 1-94, partial [Tanacetum coccineum]
LSHASDDDKSLCLVCMAQDIGGHNGECDFSHGGGIGNATVVVPCLKEHRTPKDIWDKLTNIYASKSLTHSLFLKMELYSLKLEEGSNLHDHFNSFNQLVCQLANVDDAIKDEEQALRTTLTFEDVLKALCDNERMTGSDSSSSSDKLLVADDFERGRNFHRGSSKGRSKSRMGGDRDMSVVECYYCRDKGHMQVRCPQFREDLKSLRDSKEKKKVDNCEMI